MNEHLRTAFIGFVKTTAVAIVTVIVIIAGVQLFYSGQNATQQSTFEAIREATDRSAHQSAALACVLLLPQELQPNGDLARNRVEGLRCYRDEGLRPPASILDHG